MSDLELRRAILDSLGETAEGKGFERLETVPSASGRIRRPDLALRKGLRLLVVQIRMYGWAGSAVIDDRSLLPLLLQFEDIRRGCGFDVVRGLIISVHEFDEKARALAKDYGVGLMRLAVDDSTNRVEKVYLDQFEECLR